MRAPAPLHERATTSLAKGGNWDFNNDSDTLEFSARGSQRIRVWPSSPSQILTFSPSVYRIQLLGRQSRPSVAACQHVLPACRLPSGFHRFTPRRQEAEFARPSISLVSTKETAS